MQGSGWDTRSNHVPPPLHRCTSSQEAGFALSCHFETIWFLQLLSRRGRPDNPGIPESQIVSPSIQETSPLFFHIPFPLRLVGQKSFWNHPVESCSRIKVTGGDLSCRGAVRFTVTQLTDSQTTRDPCSSPFPPARRSFLHQCNHKSTFF